MSNGDEREPALPRDRKTDPDVNLTDRELLQNLVKAVDSLDRTVHGVAGDMRLLSVTLDAAVEHWQSLGRRVTELERRVGRLESANGSEHPGAGI